MPRPSQLTTFYPTFVKFFNRASKKSFTEKKLRQILDQFVFETDGLTKRSLDIVKFLVRKGDLSESVIHNNNTERSIFNRIYSWRTSDLYTIISGINYNGYYSHYSAMSIHNLTLQLPKTIYFNYEKSNPYESPSENKLRRSELEQESIDNAFAKQQRKTSSEYIYDDLNVILVNGKFTDKLGVILESHHDRYFYYTDLERTLIDIAVRPDYSGGVFEVLEAYQKAKDYCDVQKMIAYLNHLNYIYPYHQVIGFYMQKANYPYDMYKHFMKGITHKFYLTYGMRRVNFSDDWQLFYPFGM